MSDTTSKEIIELVDHLFKNGYNPNVIRLNLEQMKSDLILLIKYSESFDDLLTTLETYSTILYPTAVGGNPNE